MMTEPAADPCTRGLGPRHRSPRGPASICAVRAVGVLTSGAAAAVGVAAWAPSTAQAADPQQIATQVLSLRAAAETATQQYDQATQNMARLQQQIDALQAQTTLAQAAVQRYSSSLGRIAAAQYRGIGVDPTLQLLLAQQPDQFLQRAATMDNVSRGQDEALESAEQAQLRLEQFRAQAGVDTVLAAQEEQQAAADKGRILAEYQQAQALLRQLTLSEQQALNYSGVTPQQIEGVPVSTGRAAQAIAFAESKLGLWYEWGGTGDPGYDCSGLVQAAWASAGVQLPRVTWDQMTVGQAVPADERDLQPGDLIFYLDGAHVAMYIGNGLVIHAPTTGQQIRYGEWDMMPVAAVRRVLPPT
ncbi:C40 family peptidase [Actinospica durhamensis]|uniref:C40 family peptidase n=1 Tax=Actinospica durhamensis TaxID=1508375 RepID=A0A941EWX6_9ACTN|nr:C40 family peptidase [Actinospica durhamensis]MBR7839350.1 C40 family peptidase [Actinospica durhamensis]